MPRSLITGVGHRNGIGYAIAQLLCDRGDKVFVTRWSPFDQARDYSLETEVHWPSINADLGDPASPGRIFDAAIAEMGGVDNLVLNHTFHQADGLLSLQPEVLDRHLAVNVRGSILMCQEYARRNPGIGGHIVFLTSGQSLHPMPDELSYVASKGALEAISLSLSATFAPLNVTVNAVDPGGTNTGWMLAEDVERWSASSPRGRVGTPIDAARLIAFLTSDEATWITGQLIRSRGAS